MLFGSRGFPEAAQFPQSSFVRQRTSGFFSNLNSPPEFPPVSQEFQNFPTPDPVIDVADQNEQRPSDFQPDAALVLLKFLSNLAQ